MANTPRVRLTTSTTTDGRAANHTADTNVEMQGHPVGTVVSPQPGSDMPLVALTLGQNLSLMGYLMGVSVGGTGANLSATQGLLYQPGAGDPVSTLDTTSATDDQVLASDGSGGLEFIDVVTPTSIADYYPWTVAQGGTGLETITAGHVLYGNGTSAIGNEENLFYDATNNRLGIGEISAFGLSQGEGPSYPEKTVSVWGDLAVYNPSVLSGVEVLSNGSFDSASNWYVVGDIAISGGKAVWTYFDGSLTDLTQDAADFANPIASSTLYALTYTVSGSSGSPTAQLLAQEPVGGGSSLDLGLTDGEHTVTFTSYSGAMSEFTIRAYLTAGQAFSLDDMSLQEVVGAQTAILLDDSGAITAGSITLEDSGPGILQQASAGSAVTVEPLLVSHDDTKVFIYHGAGMVDLEFQALGSLSFIGHDEATSLEMLSSWVKITPSLAIGGVDGSAVLTLPAGTATAGTAPLKFTTGTALTTPEDGAVEYHASHLYMTIGATRYQLDQQSGGVPTTITVANEATDTTCFPLFVTAATGDLGPKTSAGLTFESAIKALRVNIPASTNQFDVGVPDPSTSNLVPNMTNYTAPSGTVTYSTEYDGSGTYAAWRAFNGATTYPGWVSSANTGWIAYEFASPQLVTKYRLYSDYYQPKTWTFDGWNGSGWDTLDSQSNITTWSGWNTYTFSNTTTYAKYRLNITVSNDASIIGIQEFEIHGTGAAVTALAVTTLGNVAIGAATTSAKLDVRGSVIINEDGGDNDVRMESQTSTDLFHLDASTNRIGIGIAAPSYKLDVVGDSASAESYYGPVISVTDTNGGGTAANLVLSAGLKSGSKPYMGTISNHPFYFTTNNSYKFGVSAAGGTSFGTTYYSTDAGASNVIIEGGLAVGGTTAPSAGTIKATEMLIGTDYVVHAANATKTTAAAPYTNDGYITVTINGTAVKLMTTA